MGPRQLSNLPSTKAATAYICQLINFFLNVDYAHFVDLTILVAELSHA